ncbi:uncharacterized protein LOC133869677 isoform X1 [Alnus glutinosa]|uniref:uncharacterized protein LOC133869677 isoform X1 n=1 Tax=Alnus glutinosa TaxID=3517 RepID=UPI002D797807|nr:uncharacterized protein LOC133869677 isoform X1 [Alnus glutinosa]
MKGSRRTIQAILSSTGRSFSYSIPRVYSPSLSYVKKRLSFLASFPTQRLPLQSPFLSRLLDFPRKPNSSVVSSSVTLRLVSTSSSSSSSSEEQQDIDVDPNEHEDPFQCETIGEGESTDGWEEEDEAEPEIGDGGDGGGVVFQGVPWGESTLSIACDVLLQFGNDMKLYAFKTTPRGYVYVRLDKLTNEYGCPSMEELESYSQEFKKRLDEVGELGKIPNNLALEVSSPGAERMVKVPDDLDRFKDKPMRVCYVDVESKCQEKDGVFMLDSMETESESCVWKLANVKENRDPESKGRPLSRKQKDWRLKVPFGMHKRVFLYLEY